MAHQQQDDHRHGGGGVADRMVGVGTDKEEEEVDAQRPPEDRDSEDIHHTHVEGNRVRSTR